jgi:hypothetical protein
VFLDVFEKIIDKPGVFQACPKIMHGGQAA